MGQPDPIVCLDALTDTTYSPGEEWTQTRIFQKGPTAGMEGQFRLVFNLDLVGRIMQDLYISKVLSYFRCECKENGAISCRSLVSFNLDLIQHEATLSNFSNFS